MKVINHRVQGNQLLSDGKLIAIPREAEHYPKDYLYRQKDAHARMRILYQPQTGTGTSKRVSTEQEYTTKSKRKHLRKPTTDSPKTARIF